MTLLVATGLTKAFHRGSRARRGEARPAVVDVDVRVDRGQTVAIVGESGAGKSTTGRMLLRLIEPDAGQVTFDGVDVLALRPEALRRQRQRMQMIFQDPWSALDPRGRIGAALAEPLAIHTDLDRDERRERVVGLIRRVGLSEGVLDRRPGELSGGQLQRVVIARALATGPELLVCDEPVSALDVSVGAQVIDLLLQLQASDGMALVFVSHDLRLVRAIADEVLVMRAGRIVERTGPDELFEAPRDPYTQRLVAAVPGRRRQVRPPRSLHYEVVDGLGP